MTSERGCVVAFLYIYGVAACTVVAVEANELAHNGIRKWMRPSILIGKFDFCICCAAQRTKYIDRTEIK